jgi:starch synthase
MAVALNVLMVAAENDGIRTPKGQEAKAGGIGDVVRDTPPALASLPNPDCRVAVAVPSYGFLNKLEGARLLHAYDYSFAGSQELVALYQVEGKKPHNKIRHLVLHNPRFESRNPDSKRRVIYCDDPPARPFATDATKYACFCAAIAEGLKSNQFGDINRLHLHDWHAAFLLILRLLDPEFEFLKGLRTVYTIHNLALQGIRPLRDDPSSLAAWYPHLTVRDAKEQLLIDPEYRNCVNPMAVGIRLSDAVHVVSPGYKLEVLQPSIPRRSNPDAIRIGGSVA